MLPNQSSVASTRARWFSRAGLLLVATAFLAFLLISSVLLRGWRLDLTESGLYTLDEGSKRILARIEEPVHLQLFFSESASRGVPAVRNYAQRVREMLQEYARLSQGKLKVSFVDPQPFSEDEDRAAQFGLQAVPVSAGVELYFGLAGTNSVDEKEVLPFLHPDREATLEYDISRLVSRLASAKRPVVQVLAGVQVMGGFDMMTRQPQPAWLAFEQLKQTADVRMMKADVTEIPKETDLLVLVQPKGLNDAARFAIDQYVLGGGKLMLLTDPFAEADRAAPMGGAPAAGADDLSALLNAWGLHYDPQQIVLDAGSALAVSGGPGRPPVNHLALLGVQKSGFAEGEQLVGGLETLNFGFAGALSKKDGATSTFTALVSSTSESKLTPRAQLEMLQDPAALAQGFVADNTPKVIAARLTGPAKSAFEKAPEGFTGEHRRDAVEAGIQVLVVADIDWLTDRYWVQVQDFFGQRVAQAFADNGNFLHSAVEQYSGSADLIGLRSRGRYARPFTAVEALRREAASEFRVREEQLQTRLQETESKLSDLQKRVNQTGSLQINPQEEQALQDFQQEKVRIRKELREVQHQLNRDINALGTRLKLLNTLAVPLLLIGIAAFVALSRGQGRRAARASVGARS